MKAISPVIATVIIVAVAIAISIAVALWMTGLVSAFTGVEKLEITSRYAELISRGEYNITITIRNTGTKTATINMISINDRPYDVEGLPISLNPGEEATIRFKYTGPSGLTLSIVVHTAAGGQYPTSVTLP